MRTSTRQHRLRTILKAASTNVLRKGLALGLALVTLSGCATAARWHDPVAPYAEKPEDCAKQMQGRPPTELELARQRACEMHAAYTAAMGGAQSLSDKINLGLLGLGAATAGLAMTGTTGVPLIAMALAGATGFTANDLFVPAKAHREIFAVGAEASDCVRRLANEYVQAAGQLPNLKAAKERLTTAKRKLADAVGELENVLEDRVGEAEQATSAWKAAKKLAGSAKTVVSEADKSLPAVDDQVRGLEVTAAGELNRTLTSVRVAIKRAALTASPTVAEVQSAIRAFSADVPAAYTNLTNLAKAQSDVKASKDATEANRASRQLGRKAVSEAKEKEIEEKTKIVQARLDEVATERSALADVSAKAAVPDAQARLEACLAKAQTAPVRRPIQVGSPTLAGKAGETLHTVVSGGVGPYTIALVNADPVKTDIQLPQGAIKPDANTKIAEIVIVLGAKAVAGSYTVQIIDTGGGELAKAASINLTVIPTAADEKKEEKADKPLSVTTPNKTVNVNKTITFTISGGTPPYTVGEISGPGESANFTIEPETGTNVGETNTVKVTPAESATLGEYTLKIRDTKTEVDSPSFKVIKGEGAAPASAQMPTPDDVRAAQSLLKRRGYDVPVDGKLSDRTRLVLGQFQAAERIAVTHGLDTVTRKKLGLTERPITRADVETAQRMLRDLHLYDGPIDGIAGPRTTDALGKLQRAQGLPETGVLDAATVAAFAQGAPAQPARRQAN
jgi:putative peptidoglycan binding protein